MALHVSVELFSARQKKFFSLSLMKAFNFLPPLRYLVDKNPQGVEMTAMDPCI
jgi:hypothetical protein